ncbi:MAG: ribosome-associated translation inhibitor RaiA [Deltaproteobacteria bacterium]|nr:ribosome-associated translation inhibitor RaiA [Deltaproteobacteria bacterium]MCL5792119.1 ribosome-associated translation inhibitor RaiA [Deltaproteobacteria bacterium]
MNIQATFRHIPPSDAVKQYAEEKIKKIASNLKEPVEIHIIFLQEKKNNAVELTLTSPGTELHAKEEGIDMYAAIDIIYDKLSKQITKLKEKKKNHYASRSIKHIAQEEDNSEESDIVVIPDKEYFIKPMTTEEAVLQLDIVKESFLVYLDAEEQKVNVIFKKDDGNYGLIETGARYK